jgi:hypothetical protein
MAMRVTKKDLERELKRLNETFGFKGYKYGRLKNGKLKPMGKGFDIDSAYGGVSLVFMKAPSTGQSTISRRMSSRELYDYMQSLRSGVDMYRRRSKM